MRQPLKTRGPGDWLAGTCFGLLAAAVMLYVAVRLMESVWPELLTMLIVGLVISAVIRIRHARNRGW